MEEEPPKKKFFLKRYGSDPGIIYRTPDGQNCLEKSTEMGLLGAKVGIALSIVDVMLISKPSTFMGTVARTGLVTVPSAAGFTTMAATSCLLGTIRNKDDMLNHLAGGFAGAFIFRIRGGTKMALGFAAMACVVFGAMKQVKVEGYDIFPDTLQPEMVRNREKWMLPPPDQRSKPPENY